MSVSPQGDSLVKDILLVNKNPFYLHGYVIPFAVIYSVAVGLLTQYVDLESYGVWTVVLVSLFLCQVLTILSCFWSVDMRCFLTCKKVPMNNYLSVDSINVVI